MKKEINQAAGTQEIGEADLQIYDDCCKKNHVHTEFVPVNDFNIHHLPEGCQDNNLVEFVKCLADLTVRLAVKMTSPERPEFWPNTNQPYPFYDMHGRDVMMLGTGIILFVLQIEDLQQTLCPCHKCQYSDTPSKVHYHIYMKTATHVVFDDLEARHTTARVFFDGQDSPLVTMDRWRVVHRDVAVDTSYLKYVTCDVDLAEKIFNMTQFMWDLYKTIDDKYKSEKLAIILSHPHGCPKQVSVGRVVEDITLAEGYGIKLTKHHYTTSTCQGSSGAAVFIPSKDATPFIERDSKLVLLNSLPHSGVNSTGISFSATSSNPTIKGVETNTLKGFTTREQATYSFPSYISVTIALVGLILSSTALGMIAVKKQGGISAFSKPPEATTCLDCTLLKDTYKNHSSAIKIWTRNINDRHKECCVTKFKAWEAILSMMISSQKERGALFPSESGKTKVLNNIFHASPVTAHKRFQVEKSGETDYGENGFFNAQPAETNGNIDHARGVDVSAKGLILKYSGLYFVYLMVIFKQDLNCSSENNKRKRLVSPKTSYHFVHRLSPNKPMGTGALLRSAHTVSQDCVISRDNSYTGGLFQLEADDRLLVSISSDVIEQRQQSIYLGLIMMKS